MGQVDKFYDMWGVDIVTQLFELVVHYCTQCPVFAFVVNGFAKFRESCPWSDIVQGGCVFTENLNCLHMGLFCKPMFRVLFVSPFPKLEVEYGITLFIVINGSNYSSPLDGLTTLDIDLFEFTVKCEVFTVLD